MATASGNCFYDLEARLSNKEMRAKRLARLKSQNFGTDTKAQTSVKTEHTESSDFVKNEEPIQEEVITRVNPKITEEPSAVNPKVTPQENSVEANTEDSARVSRELAELKHLVSEIPSLEFLKERMATLSPSKVTMSGLLGFYRIIVNTLKTSGTAPQVNKKTETRKIIEMEAIISNKEKEAFLYREQLNKAEKQVTEAENRCDKLKMDFENYKGRTQQDVKLKTEKAVSDIFKKILPIIDNFERAFNASKTSNDKESFSKGVEMILAQFENTLKGFGITKMNPLLKPFDPNVHEALMTEVNNAHPDDTVIEVLSNGYLFNNKLLRPASVKVSKRQ